MKTKPKAARRDDAPLTMEQILQRDNIPATKPMPAEVATKLACSRIVLSSDDRDFDPRKNFTRVEGARGSWELTIREPVADGLRVKTMERVAPPARTRASRAVRHTDAFRPPWQPYVYHPKTMAAAAIAERSTIVRKGGQRVQPQGVFNRDDRELFVPDGYPWHCVGRVFRNTGNGWTGGATGTLVGPRTVLCSAHMVPWGQPGAMMRFVPGYFGAVTMPSVQRVANGRGTSSNVTDVRGYNVPERAGWDLAVLRLSEPLGAWLGSFGTQTYNDDWEDDPRWTLVGYPVEWGGRNINPPFLPPLYVPIVTNGELPTRQFGISVEDDDSDGSALELEHYADSSPGNSGGPLFGHFPKGPYVIGVQSGSEILESFAGSSVTNIAAGGNAMVDLVRWAKDTWV